jgi:hypothetical protein
MVVTMAGQTSSKPRVMVHPLNFFGQVMVALVKMAAGERTIEN